MEHPVPGKSKAEPGSGSRAAPALSWVLWDGTCGFCCWWVEWARARDAERRLGFLAYQEAPDWLLPPEWRRRAARSVQLVLGERRLEGASACLHVLGVVGHGVLARILGRPPLRWAVQAGYHAVASHRGWLARFFYRDPERCRNREGPPHAGTPEGSGLLNLPGSG